MSETAQLARFSAANYQDSVRRLLDRLVERDELGSSKAKDFGDTVCRHPPTEFIERATLAGLPAVALAEELATGFDWTIYDPARHLPAEREELWILSHSGVLLVANPFDSRLVSKLNDRFHGVIKGYGVLPYTARIAAESHSWATIADPTRARDYVVDLIYRAAKLGVSDIQVQPEKNGVHVLYTLDGEARCVEELPHALYKDIAGTLMSMANRNPGEHIRPVGGRIVLEEKAKRTELRMEAIETVVDGDRIPHFTLRILSSRVVRRDITDLGFRAHQADQLLDCVRAPQGIIIVSGPTGAGKSTSQGACLCWLKDLAPGKMIFTIEDPVETEYPGIAQIQVNEKAGMTFAVALRSLLRKAPKVILVGEIRDAETMFAAVEAAQTGHLIMTTLHANEAASVFDRASLIGDEVKPILGQLATVSLAYTGQRLLRRVCPRCSMEMKWSEALEPKNRAVREFKSGLLEQVYKRAHERYANHLFAPQGDPLVRVSNPRGCDHCNGGYRGRVLITEVLTLSDHLRDLLRRGAPASEVERAAVAEGFRPMWDHAFECIAKQQTTLEEAESNLSLPTPESSRTANAESRSGGSTVTPLRSHL